MAEEREEAEKKFKQVGAAHAILSDPAKRQKYDQGAQDTLLGRYCCGGCTLPMQHLIGSPVNLFHAGSCRHDENSWH